MGMGKSYLQGVTLGLENVIQLNLKSMSVFVGQWTHLYSITMQFGQEMSFSHPTSALAITYIRLCSGQNSPQRGGGTANYSTL